MKKLSLLIFSMLFGVVGYFTLFPLEAQAIPAFARKYDIPCTMCHTAFPKLNDFGVNFRDNGYQMGADSDLPQNLDKSYFPLAFRTTVGYEYASQDKLLNGAASGATSNYSSGLGSVGMDFLSAGTLDRDISYLIVPTGENSVLGGPATFHLESAWIRFDNMMDSPMLNLKVGYGDIDLPFSEHRSLTFNTVYAIYHYVPGVPYNSSMFAVGDAASTSFANFNGFAFGDHQGVLQLAGHQTNSIGNFRYALNALSNNQYGGHDIGYYAHVTQSIGGGGYSSGYRGGLFYLDEPMATVYNNVAGPAAGNIGSEAKSVTKYGVDLSGNFLGNKLNVFGVYMLGQEAAELFGPGTPNDAKFWGGFVEANYMATPKLVLIGRYDVIKNTTQPFANINTGCTNYTGIAPAPATCTAPGAATISTDGFNDVNSVTLAARYMIAVHARGEIWWHAELNETTNTKTAFDGTDQKNDTLFVGLDFAY